MEREQREREEAEKQQEEEREEARRSEDAEQENISQMETVAGKRRRNDLSESKMDTDGGGDSRQRATDRQSSSKKGHLMNIYLTDSDEETVVDSVKDHKELYDKPTRSSRTTPGRIACEKDSQTAASSQ